MGLFIANAFSLNMVTAPAVVKVSEVDIETVKDFLKNGYTSAVGHQSTADYIKVVTGIDVVANRISISLKPGDMLIVLQLLGRLPEGSVLSQDDLAKVPCKWYMVEVV